MTGTVAPELSRQPAAPPLRIWRRDLVTELAAPYYRAALWLGLVGILGLAVWFATAEGNGLDLGIYRAGGAAVLRGQALYDPSFAVEHILSFTYPPFAAVIFTPLSLLPRTAAFTLWAAASILAAGALVAASVVAVRRTALPRRALPFVIVAGGLLSSLLSPVRNCLGLGQLGVFLVLACISDVALPRTRWPRGLLVGLMTAMKMTPGLFIIYFAIVRDWKAFRTSVATVVACWGVAAVLLPHDSWAYFGRGAGFDSHRVGVTRDHLNESVNGLWHRLAVPDPSSWWLASAVLLLAVGLWRAVRASRDGNVLAAAVIVGLLSDLVAPISWLHHAIWVVPALVLLLISDGSRRGRLVSLGGAVVALEILLLPIQLSAGIDSFSRGLAVEIYVVLFVLMVCLLPIRSARQ